VTVQLLVSLALQLLALAAVVALVVLTAYTEVLAALAAVETEEVAEKVSFQTAVLLIPVAAVAVQDNLVTPRVLAVPES
jgi:hypothetical protein